MTRRTGVFALATAVAVVYVAAACLQTESLGSDQSSVVSPCDRTACTGTPDWVLCEGDRWVAPTGRCVANDLGECAWEPASCDLPPDSGDAADTEPKYVGDTSLMCGDGAVPLKATGPWDDTRKCWLPMVHYFECVPMIGGVSRAACFLDMETGLYYVSSTTHTPAAAKYRLCTKEEHDARVGLVMCD